MKLSARVERIQPSLTLAITAQAKALRAAGKDVVSFAAGEPDFPTPAPICEAAIEAIRAGHTRYTPVDGIPQLKDAIRERYVREHGLQWDADQVAVTVGGKQALFNLILAGVDHGDGVLIPAPYWVSYPDQVKVAGGEPQFVPTHVEHGFELQPDDLEAAIRPNSKVLILTTPSNPTGAAIGAPALKSIAEICERHGIWIISDEIYEKLVYDDFRHVSIASVSDYAREHTVIVNGASKAYAMTGWRIGYMAGPRDWVRAAVKLQGQSTSNPTSIGQYATIAALNLPAETLETMRTTFERRRNLICGLLNDIDGVNCPVPRGAFYVFPDVSDAISDRFDSSFTFAEQLVEQCHVAVVPGEGFGAPGHIRLSYACSDDDIERGIARIREFLGK
ncbi:MAG: pyridoxal phosphate-dependent aminotransferase [Candidatus Dadabacteria bacterium]|nr:MAG: pyridoxal phosphate-dependent aminotransferase [Candidatus Dadabacteria bacterium]